MKLHRNWQIGQFGHTAEHNEIASRLLNVTDYDAKGDGSTDDTSALQAAIDDCPEGGCVLFPRQRYKLSTLTINKGITLLGSGWYASGYPDYGGAWSNYVFGTVLLSSVTTGAAILYTGNSVRRFNVQNLAVVGPGSGTSIGISCQHTITNSRWENVLAANFSVGIKWSDVEVSHASQITVAGCDTGWQFDTNANQNTLLQTQINACKTYGLKVANSVLNNFIGGAAQGNTGTVVYLEEADGTKLDSVYFENVTATYAIDISRIGNISSDRCGLFNCHFGTLSDKIIVRGNQNYILFPQISGATLEFTGNDNLFMGVWNGSVIDTGLNNRVQDMTNTNTSIVVGQYTDNAAAIAAGLKVGQTYRTGDLLKVVH